MKNNHLTDRLIKTYGYCENESYGFINKIFTEYSINENILILNGLQLNESQYWCYYGQKSNHGYLD